MISDITCSASLQSADIERSDAVLTEGHQQVTLYTATPEVLPDDARMPSIDPPEGLPVVAAVSTSRRCTSSWTTS